MATYKNTKDAIPGENGRLEEMGRNCYVYQSDGCANTGFVIGERGVLVIDGQPTPALSQTALEKLREVTDKPVKLLVLTHFHADVSAGISGFEPGEIIASDLTRRMSDTRGKQEIQVARSRFENVFGGLPHGTPPVVPSMTIASSMSIDLGGCEVRLMHLGRAHTMGDLVVWVPQSGVLFAGDVVQTEAAPYCGDAHLADWPRALDRIAAFRPSALMPGRGKPAQGAAAVSTAIENTREFVTGLRDAAAACVEGSMGLKDTFEAVKDALSPQFSGRTDFEEHLPFNVARAYDEALGLDQPQIWTLERCADLTDALAGGSGIPAVPEPDSEADQPAVHPEDNPPEDSGNQAQEPQGTLETASEDPSGELVSDDVFAQSLLGDEQPSEGSSDAETSGTEAVEDEKVLEDARQ
ncbi:MBL fold metallo-hydrolase [Roseibium denhamense]|uniref:Glyoxylase, beta-lactamase superfamily II n=2 Tax=Roseibium denhamense TaxID=76305 RepID=A0ABY1NW74_9HYPH|nr:MBL fold metallo-hydrolase [Roseibium denhamense]SMP18569.1 Glyoxylase, beta-lactamase superfamily II [Roseibium denhamense]